MRSTARALGPGFRSRLVLRPQLLEESTRLLLVAINSDIRPTDIETLERYGIRTLIAPGVGHFLMLENPDTFNRLLSETIAGFKPSALP